MGVDQSDYPSDVHVETSRPERGSEGAEEHKRDVSNGGRRAGVREGAEIDEPHPRGPDAGPGGRDPHAETGGAPDAGVPGVREDAFLFENDADKPPSGSTGPEHVEPVERPSFSNKTPSSLEVEMAAVGETGFEPMSPKDPAFDRARETWEEGGDAVNYVVTEQGELKVGPQKVGDVHIHHSVLAGGEPVLAAGQVQLAADRVISLDNESGHYHPSAESLDVAARAWEDAGFMVSERALRSSLDR